MLAAETEKCPERNAQSHTPLHSGSDAHEIQRQQQVGANRKYEAVMKEKNDRATSGASVPWQQQLRQQQAQRQCLQQEQQALRNGSGLPHGKKTYKHLFTQVYAYDNLLLAFKKARKRKTKKHTQNY